jgi:hypothetical protein
VVLRAIAEDSAVPAAGSPVSKPVLTFRVPTGS